jgi:hypothetical protein
LPPNNKANEGFIRINPQQKLSDPHAFLKEEDLHLTYHCVDNGRLGIGQPQTNNAASTQSHTLVKFSGIRQGQVEQAAFGVFASCHLFDHRWFSGLFPASLGDIHPRKTNEYEAYSYAC